MPKSLYLHGLQLNLRHPTAEIYFTDAYQFMSKNTRVLIIYPQRWCWNAGNFIPVQALVKPNGNYLGHEVATLRFDCQLRELIATETLHTHTLAFLHESDLHLHLKKSASRIYEIF